MLVSQLTLVYWSINFHRGPDTLVKAVWIVFWLLWVEKNRENLYINITPHSKYYFHIRSISSPEHFSIFYSPVFQISVSQVTNAQKRKENKNCYVIFIQLKRGLSATRLMTSVNKRLNPNSEMHCLQPAIFIRELDISIPLTFSEYIPSLTHTHTYMNILAHPLNIQNSITNLCVVKFTFPSYNPPF
jgi:hypothetical protein